MTWGTAEVDEATPIDHALDQLTTGLDHLVKVVEDGGLDYYDDPQLVQFMVAFERFRNRLPLVDHRVIREAQARGLPDSLTQATMARVLTSALRLSPAEANRRIRAAEAVGDRASMLGPALPPVRTMLAAAQRDGEVTPEQVHIIERALSAVDRAGFDPADIDNGEQLLTGFAATFGPQDLRRLAGQVVDRIDPDGSRPVDDLNTDRRHFSLRSNSDGSYGGEFRFTGSLGAKLTAVLGPLARPRITKVVRPDGTAVEEPDCRTYGQRLHDALEEVCDRALRAGDLPDNGGTPATVIVTMDLEDLIGKTGYGTTSDGTLIPTRQVLQVADEADIVPAVLTKTGAVLELGRTRRVASTMQTYALIARDRGCSFPGCAHPPEWCERHHIVPWADGGLTNLDNLTLLCRYHHHNFATRGWDCQMTPDGLPAWTPPAWIDRERRPMINSRIRAQLAARR